jgi:prevent-host-death family protein
MPIIRPISALRNNFAEISQLCHNEAEPVFVTKNGEGDLVVMSMEYYERQFALLNLYQKLDEAETEDDGETLDHDTVMNMFKERIHNHG